MAALRASSAKRIAKLPRRVPLPKMIFYHRRIQKLLAKQAAGRRGHVSDRTRDILISAWILAAGAAFVALPLLASASPGTIETILAVGRKLYAVGVAVLLAAAAVGSIRRLTGKDKASNE